MTKPAYQFSVKISDRSIDLISVLSHSEVLHIQRSTFSKLQAAGLSGMHPYDPAQGCPGGEFGGVTPPILSNLQESWSKVKRVGQKSKVKRAYHSKNSWSTGQTPPPPDGKCLGKSLARLTSPHLPLTWPSKTSSYSKLALTLSAFPGLFL